VHRSLLDRYKRQRMLFVPDHFLLPRSLSEPLVVESHLQAFLSFVHLYKQQRPPKLEAFTLKN
jgi:hypothetical protein